MEVISIRQKRIDADMTQKELALAVGVDQSAVAQWETGRTGPHREKLVRIAEVLNCSVVDLLEEHDDDNSS